VKKRPIHYNSNPAWMASILSDSGYLSLGQILGSFSAPISEEHAWYQNKLFIISDLEVTAKF
jgi:hypothetical protein